MDAQVSSGPVQRNKHAHLWGQLCLGQCTLKGHCICPDSSFFQVLEPAVPTEVSRHLLGMLQAPDILSPLVGKQVVEQRLC